MEDRGSPMMTLTVKAENISKDFNRRPVLRNISFTATSGESIAITGKNGSGKSTLVKIITGVLTPTGGVMTYELDKRACFVDELRSSIGFVAPYLQLYDEFSAMENLQLLSRIRGSALLPRERLEELFRKFGLWHRRHDVLRTYSSGMKQRMKYIFALSHRPSLVVLDEPTANLDEEGGEAVRETVHSLGRSAVLILATNDEREAAWCGKRIHLGV